jgi:hypothetical protein
MVDLITAWNGRFSDFSLLPVHFACSFPACEIFMKYYHDLSVVITNGGRHTKVSESTVFVLVPTDIVMSMPDKEDMPGTSRRQFL